MVSCSTRAELERRPHLALAPHPPTAAEFRAATGMFATGVTVVTVLSGDSGRGMTANAFSSVSLDPMLVLVCINRESEMCRLLTGIGRFAVSVLSADMTGVAQWFADRARPDGPAQFEAVDWLPGPATGAPLLRGALAWIECAVEAQLPAGDHTVVLGRVLTLDRTASAKPLTFWSGEFGTVTPLPPHTMRERLGA